MSLSNLKEIQIKKSYTTVDNHPVLIFPYSTSIAFNITSTVQVSITKIIANET